MIFIAVFIGANTVLCRYLNALYAKHNGLCMGTLVNYVTGLSTSLLFLLLAGLPAALPALGPATLRTVAMFFGGAVGVVMVQLLIYVTPRLPAFLSTVLVIVTQLGMGLVLDYAMTGVFSLNKLLGGLMVALGLWHYVRVSAREGGAA